LQISPVFVNGFKNGFHQRIQRIFLVVVEGKKRFCENVFFFGFQNLDALYRPVAGKPLVREDLCFGMGTSVATAVTPETIFEIIKCIADVDMRGRVRLGSKCEIFRFFRRRASRVTGNMLIKPDYVNVRQSRDSLHRDTHNVTKKSRGGAVL